MDWENIHYFVELARCGSLSAAARHLRVDHSTVARRIAALETELGIRLFDRLPRGYALTPAGEQMAGLAERLEEDVFAIERFARGQPDEPAGSVRLSAPPVFASAFLAPRLGPLRLRFPKVVLELIGESRPAFLNRREADLAIRLERPQDPGLVARRLGGLSYALYATAAYLNGRAESQWEFVAYDGSLDHVPQQRWLLAEAAGRPIVLRANDLASLHAAVCAGLGVSALPCFLADPQPELVRLPSSGDGVTRDLWLLVHPDLRRAAPVRVVMDFLIELTDGSAAALQGL